MFPQECSNKVIIYLYVRLMLSENEAVTVIRFKELRITISRISQLQRIYIMDAICGDSFQADSINHARHWQ